MNAHRIETQMNERGTLTLRDLPFEAGANVEVIVLETASNGIRDNGNGVNGAQANTRALENDGESWAESLARECEELCEIHGYGDAPPDFAATWKKEKGRRIMQQNEQL